MSDEQRLWESAPPIRARQGEVFNHENVELYDVERAIREINAKPAKFQFLVLAIEALLPQVTGRGNIDLAYVNRLSNEDAIRPVLLGTYANESVRLLDGYHRIMRLSQFQIEVVGTWKLSSEQTKAILLPREYMNNVEHV